MVAYPYITGVQFDEKSISQSLFIESVEVQNEGFNFTFSKQQDSTVVFIGINYLYYDPDQNQNLKIQKQILEEYQLISKQYNQDGEKLFKASDLYFDKNLNCSQEYQEPFNLIGMTGFLQSQQTQQILIDREQIIDQKQIINIQNNEFQRKSSIQLLQFYQKKNEEVKIKDSCSVYQNKCSEKYPAQYYCEEGLIQQKCTKCLNCPADCNSVQMCCDSTKLNFNISLNNCECLDNQTMQYDDLTNQCNCIDQIYMKKQNNSCICNDLMKFNYEKQICKCNDEQTMIKDPDLKKCVCIDQTLMRYSDSEQKCMCLDQNFMKFDENLKTCVCLYQINMAFNKDTKKCECKKNMAFNASKRICECIDQNSTYNTKTDQCECKERMQFNSKKQMCECKDQNSIYKDETQQCECQSGMKFNDDIQKCECVDQNTMKYNQITEECECILDEMTFSKSLKQCICSDKSYYYNNHLDKCILNPSFKYCEILEQFRPLCLKCQKGFQNFNGTCKYCGNNLNQIFAYNLQAKSQQELEFQYIPRISINAFKFLNQSFANKKQHNDQ
ncbi:hypothetical protein TTHERM_01186270 (macronuclear) [Tetrahymena thermophila SB210]|uniref:Uncharacterized protein n=1 Tax=Tetrahymena thermophila (strain SB210) TaxID=312017 RepID=Q23RR0_TETTS|nr:hypothetical protein TTHERM_01186270 [Tetrahymena thermophila SB210]EAR99225.2 hypothetical protein TTHERM_01186270 [Tetrahymena thermophila SB210]|eukprot:XP_001019470.2 hypothetical protein TTHERM_01186270 [Tetrahymena thermophila SB210]